MVENDKKASDLLAGNKEEVSTEHFAIKLGEMVDDLTREQPEYWHCIVGPIIKSELKRPNKPTDPPMRVAVEDAFINLTNKNAGIIHSGWGMSNYNARLTSCFANMVSGHEQDTLHGRITDSESKAAILAVEKFLEISDAKIGRKSYDIGSFDYDWDHKYFDGQAKILDNQTEESACFATRYKQLHNVQGNYPTKEMLKQYPCSPDQVYSSRDNEAIRICKHMFHRSDVSIIDQIEILKEANKSLDVSDVYNVSLMQAFHGVFTVGSFLQMLGYPESVYNNSVAVDEAITDVEFETVKVGDLSDGDRLTLTPVSDDIYYKECITEGGAVTIALVGSDNFRMIGRDTEVYPASVYKPVSAASLIRGDFFKLKPNEKAPQYIVTGFSGDRTEVIARSQDNKPKKVDILKVVYRDNRQHGI